MPDDLEYNAPLGGGQPVAGKEHIGFSYADWEKPEKPDDAVLAAEKRYRLGKQFAAARVKQKQQPERKSILQRLRGE